MSPAQSCPGMYWQETPSPWAIKYYQYFIDASPVYFDWHHHTQDFSLLANFGVSISETVSMF